LDRNQKVEDKKMKYLYILVFLVLLSAGALAQDEFVGSFTYNIAVPTSHTREFVDNTSFRGIGLEFNKYLKPQFSIGFAASWNVFYHRTNEVTEIESGHVSGTQLRYINSFPFLLTGRYFLETSGNLKPYLGAGAGAYYIMNELNIGIYAITHNNFHFGFAPELGFMIASGGESAFTANIKYNYAFGAGGTEDYSYWGVNLGVAFTEFFGVY
jgi:outer membrane protein W